MVAHALLPAINEVLRAEADVSRNDPNEGRSHVASAVIRYRCRAPIRVPKLLMRTALPDLDEAEAGQDRDDDSRTQRGDATHGSRNVESLRPDERGFELRIAIFAQ
jgi:hypothetical protein